MKCDTPHLHAVILEDSAAWLLQGLVVLIEGLDRAKCMCAVLGSMCRMIAGNPASMT